MAVIMILSCALIIVIGDMMPLAMPEAGDSLLLPMRDIAGRLLTLFSTLPVAAELAIINIT